MIEIKLNEPKLWLNQPCYAVTHAAALIVGINPDAITEDQFCQWIVKSDWERTNDAIVLSRALNPEDKTEFIKPNKDEVSWHGKINTSFNAVLISLFRAIQKGILPADKCYEPKVLSPKTNEGQYGRFREASTITYIFDGAPNLGTTTIDKPDLIAWLEKYDMKDNIFFQKQQAATDGGLPGYLNPDHTHYSPKLHAAVSAWLAVDADPPGQKNVKFALETWISDHVDKFKNKKGKVLASDAIKEAATVANWYGQKGSKDSD